MLSALLGREVVTPDVCPVRISPTRGQCDHLTVWRPKWLTSGSSGSALDIQAKTRPRGDIALPGDCRDGHDSCAGRPLGG
jgi:hypothetical protein